MKTLQELQAEYNALTSDVNKIKAFVDVNVKTLDQETLIFITTELNLKGALLGTLSLRIAKLTTQNQQPKG